MLFKHLKQRRCFFELAKLFGWQFDQGESAWPLIQDDPTPNAVLCAPDAQAELWRALADHQSQLSIYMSIGGFTYNGALSVMSACESMFSALCVLP